LSCIQLVIASSHVCVYIHGTFLSQERNMHVYTKKMYIHIFVYMYIFIYICVHIYMYVYIHIHMNIYIYTNICIHIFWVYTCVFLSCERKVPCIYTHTCEEAITCRMHDKICSYVCCNTVQHCASHCNTLQHTAIHCNKLQHTAT